MRARFIELEKNTKKKELLYLDIISWLKAKSKTEKLAILLRKSKINR
jgi:hypothetical protein